MSGSSDFPIPASTFQPPAGGLAAGTWYRGIPTLPATVSGISDCRDLVASSPPNLLIEYEFYTLALGISAGAIFAAAPAAPPVLSAEIALLVNDRIKYRESVKQTSVGDGTGVGFWVSTFFGADLVNPIRLHARERLSLRVGIETDTAAIGAAVYIGSQVDANGNPVIPAESTISYNVIDLPASRRL